MFQGVQANPQWKACDGKPYYVLDPAQSFRTVTAADLPAKGWRNDYWRRMGRWGRRRGLGPVGWIVCMPVNAGWVVTLATDSTEVALTTPPTVMHPPAGTE
jgi:hypothetical protein